MAYLGALTGIGPNAANQGANFQAGHANLTDPVTGQQLTQASDNTQAGLQDQQNFINALAGQNGIQNQSNVYNQYQQIANGTGGPNPAQNMLNQATAANVANQASLAAGQRGSSQNVGMIARQAANQGANAQQQSIGQAATLNAQQQQNALAQMAGLSTQQVGQQSGAINSYNQFAQSNQGQLLGAQDAFNNASVGSIGNQNSANAGVQGALLGQQAKVAGSVAGAASGAPMLAGAAGPGMASGGEVQQNYDAGGTVNNTTVDSNKPKSFAGQFLNNSMSNATMISKPATMAKGGKVPAMVSPGEVYLPPNKVNEVAHGKDPRQVGEVIKGKAKVKGDSLKNDTVPKTLEEGGFVIPRSIMESKDAAKKAAAFVAAHLSKRGQLPKR